MLKTRGYLVVYRPFWGQKEHYMQVLKKPICGSIIQGY